MSHGSWMLLCKPFHVSELSALNSAKFIPFFLFSLLLFTTAPADWGWIQAATESNPTAMATLDRSLICELCHSLWQHWILNPMSEARDQTHILTETISGPEPTEPQQEFLFLSLKCSLCWITWRNQWGDAWNVVPQPFQRLGPCPLQISPKRQLSVRCAPFVRCPTSHLIIPVLDPHSLSRHTAAFLHSTYSYLIFACLCFCLCVCFLFAPINCKFHNAREVMLPSRSPRRVAKTMWGTIVSIQQTYRSKKWAWKRLKCVSTCTLAIWISYSKALLFYLHVCIAFHSKSNFTLLIGFVSVRLVFFFFLFLWKEKPILWKFAGAKFAACERK